MAEMKNLLRNVQVAEFALIEAGLFLDTHPGDAKALAYFREYQEKYRVAAAAYTAVYGPITMMDYDGGSSWTWTKTAFPWEAAAN